MSLYDLLLEKNVTIYSISKETGIPKSTLFDIFSGKSNLMDCRVRVVVKIAKYFNMTVEEILKLDKSPNFKFAEEDLPEFLKEGISNLKKNRNSDLYDCYVSEVNSSINVCEVEDLISHDIANYLRNKYTR